MKNTILAIAALTLTAACAQPPEKIAAVPQHGTFKCDVERAKLASLEAQQRQAVTGDLVGVLLIGIPVSSLAGNDLTPLIATAKGRVNNCV